MNLKTPKLTPLFPLRWAPAAPVYPPVPVGPTLEHLVNTNQLIGQQKLNWFGINRNDYNVINHANVLAFNAKYIHYRLAYGLETLFNVGTTKLEMAIFDLTTGREILHIRWKTDQGCLFTDYRGNCAMVLLV